MTDQIGLHKFRLSQRRYKDGAFYLSVRVNSQKVVDILDGRYFVEDGHSMIPTKNGFRIPGDKIDNFRKVLNCEFKNIGDIELFETEKFRFHIRYVNDKYGEGVDFRKYKVSEKYTGWDRSGIRMSLEDVEHLKDWIKSFNPMNIREKDNLFAGKAIGKTDDTSSDKKALVDSEINPLLKKLLEFE